MTAMLLGFLSGKALFVFFSRTIPSRAIFLTFSLWLPPTLYEPMFHELNVAVGYPLS